ncbi:conserved hypothetical protein [Amphritea japonica ATCC BAA-1530]|uniref:NarX-like N-terminal domain-containing protein n=2 Tax=Amphritea TaxID=515417 RepID=A0A7R6PDA7_9GAMM|nr:conserved hypothetical protein [Amphritea japonica ATCC BAA-1530]
MVSLLLLCVTGPTYAANISTAAEVVNAAVEQRTLIQVMLKNYVLSGLGVRSRKANQALAEAITRFDLQQQQLNAAVTDIQVLHQLKQMEQSWVLLQRQYKQKPDRARLVELYTMNENTLKQGTLLLEGMVVGNLSKGAQMLELMGQHELLCQRLSALYGMMAWGMRAEVEPAYRETYQALGDNLIKLEAIPYTTPSINQGLKKIGQQLERIRKTADASKDAFVPGLVDRSVVRMVEQANQLQAEYLQLAGSLDSTN